MSKFNDGRSIRVLAFLEAYERQECLWDSSLDSYKNKGERDQAYMEIIKELNVPSLTVHDIKLKVKGIRTTYTKELRILNAYKKMGKTYKPKLFWFNKANSFLKNVCVSRRPKKELLWPKHEPETQTESKDFELEYTDEVYSGGEEMLIEHDANDDEQIQNQDTQDYKTYMRVVKQNEPPEYDHQPSPVPQQPDNQSYAELSCTEEHSRIHINRNELPTNTFDNRTSTPPPAFSASGCKEDEFDIFCRSVASQLRAIPDTYSRSMAKLKIQQILFEAETGHYKNSPCITIPIVQQINGV